MQHWLVKSEPTSYAWDQLVADGGTAWTGVRNHMASNYLKAMRIGDRSFYYHSNTGKEIVGVVEVVREAYPDPTAKEGDWVCVDMRAVGPVPRPVTLAELKADKRFAEMPLLKYSRLSVSAVSDAHWKLICGMGG